MPSTSTVSVPIQSYIGFKRPDGAAVGGFSAPRPVLQTTETLDGATFAVTGATANSKMLYVPPLATFTYFPNTTSTAQTVTVINSGTQAVSLLGTTSTNYDTDAVINIGTLPASIPPGGSYTFNLSYYSANVGEYAESLLLVSNADSPYYRIDTLQNVISAFNFRASPTSATFTTTVLGLSSSTSIELVPIVNGADDYDTVLDFTTSITGSPGWSFTTGTNSVNLFWDPDYVDNINNTTTGYTSTLAISVVGAGSTTISNKAYVNIDYTKYRNLSTWYSAGAGNNSIIGISFDIFDGIKTVTIGVGAGGDGTPIYSEGGNIFAVMNNLKIGAGTIDIPYPYWSTVCSIPLPVAGTYLSGELNDIGLPKYVKKTTNGLDYADYFGFEQSVGSMFIVTYNGYDLVNIEINNLREPSGDTAFDLTMANLTRAFHYHSTIDNPSRYYQLEAAVPGDPRTRLFRGFVATALSGNTRTYSVNVVAATLVYNESLTGPSSVIQGSANFNVQITGGTPNTGYSWTGATSGSGTLNASGQASIPFSSGGTITESLGTYSFTATFAASGNTRTYSVNIVAAPPGPPVYNESLTGPSSVIQGSANFNVQITGGAPNTGYSWTGATSGSGTLNASGQASIPFSSGGTITESLGTYSFTATFATNPDTWIVDTSLVPLPT